VTALGVALREAWGLWAPPPRVRPSVWMEQALTVPTEETAVPGRYRFTRHAFLREVADACADPEVEVVAVQKPAQVGWTLLEAALAAYFAVCDPARLLIALPTVEEAEIWSKDRLEPLVRASPSVAALIRPARLRDANNKILHKRFPGGAIKLTGANSPTGLASWPAKRIILDEVDRYPASAGDEGDPVSLVKKRMQTYLRRGGKLIAGSTPDVAGLSLIEHLVGQGDVRRWLVPCPHAGCGREQVLEFARVEWPKEDGEHRPAGAAYRCEGCGRPWTDMERLAAVARGRWRATAPASNVRSYVIDGLMSPDVTHAELAREWLAAAHHEERRKAFANTYLGQAYRAETDTPDWRDLARKRERWPRDALPEGARLLCCGLDLQKNRREYRVWAWGRGGEAWLVESDVIPGGPEDAEAWAAVDALLERRWAAASGAPVQLDRLVVDSGAFSEEVYGWGRRYRWDDRVILGKGDARQSVVVGPRSVQEWSPKGVKAKYGVAVTIIGVDKAKDYLVRKLRLPLPLPGEEVPPGFLHLPEWAGDEELRQLVAERLVRGVDRKGYTRQEWRKAPGDPNEALDCLVYSYAGACAAGLWSAPDWWWASRAAAMAAAPAPAPEDEVPPPAAPDLGRGWIDGDRERLRGWLRRR
jgi:phage terminase large subunit GpA-like protein